MTDEYQPFADYRELITLISKLCARGLTGTLLIVSEVNNLARVVIVAGNIIHFEYRLKKGVDAIPLFKEIQQGSVEFKNGKVISHESTPLPPTATLLLQLGGKAGVSDGVAKTSSANASRLSLAEALKLIEHQLIDVLGPMATLIWEEHLERMGGPTPDLNVQQLINDVATEIDDPDKATQFCNHLLQKLA
jgi:hypothetical protein